VSEAEKRAGRWLTDMGIPWVDQWDEIPPWRLDFYLPSAHIGLEVDGPYRHHTPKRHGQRDEDLWDRARLLILRIRVKELRRETFEHAVRSFIAENEESFQERTEWWRDRKRQLA
jgi:very-short-patch-repair endonuclease